MENLAVNLENYLKAFPQIVDFGYTEQLAPLSFNHYQQWVESHLYGNMNYLTDHRKDLRKNLNLVFPQCQSALVFLFSYSKIKSFLSPQKAVAGFALGFEGKDYHHVLQEILNSIGENLKNHIPLLEFKAAVDTLPILERDLAYRAGLGFIGKNSMLISPQHGSYVMIGSLLLNKELPLPTRPLVSDHCGHCTRCLEACPTKAILPNKILDAKKCISHFTIEVFKDAPLPEGYNQQSSEIFGCDICQDVCPWNRKINQKRENQEHSLTPLQKELSDFFTQRTPKEIHDEVSQLSNNEYRRKFLGTSFLRLGKQGLLKNLKRFI